MMSYQSFKMGATAWQMYFQVPLATKNVKNYLHVKFCQNSSICG